MDETVDAAALRRTFCELYGVPLDDAAPPRLWSAPGRVNLIGEHTDYNDGYVLPLAIDRRTIAAAAARADRRVRVYSTNFDEWAEFDLDESTSAAPHRRGGWTDYVEGVARVLEARGFRLTGADLLITSGVPIGAGLSSSAALEISTGLALAGLAGVEVDKVQIALIGQEAEHLYVGTKCGIMDQLTVALARRGHALLIDCRSLEARPILLNLPDTALVICDTKVKHELASSAYNTRREECARGVELLSRALPGVRALRDVSVEDFEKFQDRLPETIRRRCRHIITDNARTLAAADALLDGDMETLGHLMAQSHESLRVDFEVSSAELDLMVELAGRCEGIVGARMTGGGFGGCTVNLVRRGALEDFREFIFREYYAATKIAPSIYIVEADDGAHELLNAHAE